MLTITILKSIKAFIDDVAMSASNESLSFQELVQKAQSQLQWWNQLVRSSGGALNPSKCYCAIYHWQPDKDGILRQTEPDPTTSLLWAEPINNAQPIPLLLLHEGTWYLGIYVTWSGATKPMEDHVWMKAITYTRAFQQMHMNRREATVLYRKKNSALKCYLSIVYGDSRRPTLVQLNQVHVGEGGACVVLAGEKPKIDKPRREILGWGKTRFALLAGNRPRAAGGNPCGWPHWVWSEVFS